MKKELIIKNENGKILIKELNKTNNEITLLEKGHSALFELKKILSTNKIIDTNVKLNISVINLENYNLYFSSNLLNNKNLKFKELLEKFLNKAELQNLYQDQNSKNSLNKLNSIKGKLSNKKKNLSYQAKITSFIALIAAVNIISLSNQSDLEKDNNETLELNYNIYPTSSIEESSNIEVSLNDLYNELNHEIPINNLHDEVNHEIPINNLHDEVNTIRLTNYLDTQKEIIQHNNTIDEFTDNLINPDNRSIFTQSTNNSYELNSKLTPELEKEFKTYLNSNEGQYILKYASDYGIDPYLMLSIAMNESRLLHNQTLPGGKYYSGYGWGLFQHYTPNNVTLEAYNFNTNIYDDEILSEENLRNVETNIKLAAMKLQTCLNKYNNNVYLAIQAYNGGEGYVNIVISKLSNQYSNTDNIPLNVLIEEFKYLSTNTKEYIATLPSNVIKYNPNAVNTLKNYNTYASSDYITKVMSYYLGSEGLYKTLDSNNNTILNTFSYEEETYFERLNTQNNKGKQLKK